MKSLLSGDETEEERYGFPTVAARTGKLLDQDMAAIAYRVDEDGEFELNRRGEKIEIARGSWYSGEWRQHFIYALTQAQKEKLLRLIDSSV